METTKKTSEENKALVRTFFNYFETGNMAKLVSELLSPGYTLHFSGKTSPMSSSETKSMMTEYTSAFPDLRFGITEQITEGDKVVTRYSLSGTHSGKFIGKPGSNKHFTVSGTSVHTIVNGQITEEWTEWNMLSMLSQLGILSSNPTSGSSSSSTTTSNSI